MAHAVYGLILDAALTVADRLAEGANMINLMVASRSSAEHHSDVGLPDNADLGEEVANALNNHRHIIAQPVASGDLDIAPQDDERARTCFAGLEHRIAILPDVALTQPHHAVDLLGGGLSSR